MEEIKKHKQEGFFMTQIKSIVCKYMNNMRHNETKDGFSDYSILIDIAVNNIFKSHVNQMKKNPIKETVV